MAENKTKYTSASVKRYLASRASQQQRADCRQLMAMMKKITRKVPKMWGPSIVGYGTLRYAYESGRSGETPMAAFAIRGPELCVYLAQEGTGQKAMLAKLGKHKMSKSCLYFKQLADVDTSVLKQLIVGSIADTRRRYPQ